MTTLSSIVSLALLWVLFFWLYKDYRLDRFRQNLFDLRYELFELGRAGHIAFGHPAYGMLRRTLNGTIRYGHRLSLVDLLVFRMLVPKKSASVRIKSYEEQWLASCENLSEETRVELDRLRDRLHMNIVEQIILTSAILVFTLIAVAMWMCTWVMRRHLFNTLRRFVNRPRIHSFLSDLDSAALARAS